MGPISNNLAAPTRLDLDAAGNLYVADPRRNKIFIFDKFSKLKSEFPVEDLSGGGLAVTPDGNKVYVACGQAVKIIDSTTGQAIGQLGNQPHLFQAAGDIARAPDGRLYVADTSRRVVLVFTADGDSVDQIGDPSRPNGQFASIFSLAVNPLTSEVYVTDSYRNSNSQAKIMVFSPAGDLLRTLAARDAAVFGDPALFFFGGMAFDPEGRGYFLDTYRSDVRIVQLPGSFISRLPMPGLLPGNLERPVDAAFDPLTKRLFVACDGGRIEIFGLNGATNPDPNRPPGMPVPFHPIAGSEVDSAAPELVFQNSQDLDHDVLTYEVRLKKDNEVIAEYRDIPEAAPRSSLQIDRSLTENAGYAWSVRARDAGSASDWTAEQAFFVNALEEPPSSPEPVLQEPPLVLDGQGLLAWTGSSDPDPYDQVSYRVDLFPAANSAEPVLSQGLSATSISLAQLDEYSLLENGAHYLWQVIGIDNHQLVSPPSEAIPFQYATTLLRISAEVPEAEVYFGGNHAYPGRYLGQVPVELRDLTPGAGSVVIEAPGYESEVVQFTLEKNQTLELRTTLRAAPEPVVDSRAKPFLKTGLAGIAPFFVDFNNDGRLDLLAGDNGGSLFLALDLAEEEEALAFAEMMLLDLPLVPGASPFVADWNNDGRKDLLVGGDDGTISLFLNQGSESDPSFVLAGLLQAAEAPLSVPGPAVPVVVDLDLDRKKDLVVGTGDGQIFYFRNLGEDHEPRLAEPRQLALFQGPVAPFAVDWDADGKRDLVVANGEELFVGLQEDQQTFPSFVRLASPLGITQNDKRLKSKPANAGRLNPALFVLDVDQKRGKDLFMTTENGVIMLVPSVARPVPSPPAETAQPQPGPDTDKTDSARQPTPERNSADSSSGQAAPPTEPPLSEKEILRLKLLRALDAKLRSR